MRSQEHVDEVWSRYDDRPISTAVDEVTLTALSRFDTPMLVEAADLVVRSAKRLDPTAWLAKARIGQRLYSDLGGGAAPATERRHAPAGFDPFAGDPTPRSPRPTLVPLLRADRGA